MDDSTMFGALGGLPSLTRPRSPSPFPFVRNVRPKIERAPVTAEEARRATWLNNLPSRFSSREPENTHIKQEPHPSSQEIAAPEKITLGSAEAQRSLARLIDDSPDHAMYSLHVKTVVQEMCSHGPLQPLKSSPWEVVSFVLGNAGANENKKRAIICTLTQGWLEKIFQHVDDVLEATGQEDVQAVMVLKRLLMKSPLSANNVDATAFTGVANVMHTKRISELGAANGVIQDDADTGSASSNTSAVKKENGTPLDSHNANDQASSAPGKQDAPVGFESLAPMKGHSAAPYPLKVNRAADKAFHTYTYLLKKGKGNTPKRTAVNETISEFVKNSANPDQEWCLHVHINGGWLVRFGKETHTTCFPGKDIKVNGAKYELESFEDTRLPQIFISQCVSTRLDYDRLLISLTAARPGCKTYVAVKRCNKSKPPKHPRIIVVVDIPTSVKYFEFFLGANPDGEEETIRFDAAIDGSLCGNCAEQHNLRNCAKLLPLKLSSGKSLEGLLKAPPVVFPPQ